MLSDCSYRVVPRSVVVLFEKVGRQRVDNHLVPTRSGANAISVVDSVGDGAVCAWAPIAIASPKIAAIAQESVCFESITCISRETLRQLSRRARQLSIP